MHAAEAVEKRRSGATGPCQCAAHPGGSARISDHSYSITGAAALMHTSATAFQVVLVADEAKKLVERCFRR